MMIEKLTSERFNIYSFILCNTNNLVWFVVCGHIVVSDAI